MRHHVYGDAMPPSGRDLSLVSVQILLDGRRHGAGELEGGFKLERGFTARVSDLALPYLLSFEIAAKDGRLVAESLTVTSRPKCPPVDSKTLRSIPVETYLARVREEAVRHGGLLMPVRSRSERAVRMGWVATPDESSRLEQAQGRRRPHQEVLEAVVEAYNEAISHFETRERATVEVAERLGYSRGHVSRLLTEARRPEIGLLGPARRGVAGELVPPKARRPKTPSTRKKAE